MRDKKTLHAVDMETLRLLSVMLGSGITALEAIGHIMQGEKDARKRMCLAYLSSGIAEGRLFSDIFAGTALSRNLIYMHILRTAEIRGGIPEALGEIVEEMSESKKHVNQLFAIMMYPAIVLLMASALILMLVFFIVPNIAPIVKNSAADLPAVTKLLFAASEMMRKDGLKIVLVGVSTLFAILLLIIKTPIRMVAERSMIKMPILGAFVIAYVSSAYTRAIGKFLEHKSDAAEVFDHLAKISYLKILRRDFARVSSGISNGKVMSVALKDALTVPHIWALFAKVAEQGSSYAVMFEVLHRHYKHVFERLSQTIIKSIEPIMMIAIGLIVGLLAYAILSPLYGMMNQMN